MQRFLTLTALVAMASGLALAETWTGKLVDANCASQQEKSATSCAPSASTASFAIETTGNKMYKLDDEGNKKAAQALQKNENGNEANRAKNPNAQSSDVMATVQGTLSGDTIQVESIQVQ